jgi:hypothetical protein
MMWTAIFLGVILPGCSHTSELFREDGTDHTADVDYSVIYYIHADSDYLFHDIAGNPVQGNIKVLDDALTVAEEAEFGEVFIFYQRPERKILGLFPRRSSRLYHYKKGKLASRVNYRHSEKSEDFFTTEARLHTHYQTHSGIEYRQNYFLYFGHEIPDDEGKKYHRTNPDITVNTVSFSGGLQKFLSSDEQRFNLVVLSTCNNGTPVMADHLLPFTDVLLASPQNLHLSHIDSKSLDLLESEPGIPSIQLANTMADQTYGRLASETETAITLTVYDFEIIQEYKNELHVFFTSYNSSGSRQHFSDNIDCREVSVFNEELFGRGLNTWYKPARFGRQSGINTHSGWGCKPVIEN